MSWLDGCEDYGHGNYVDEAPDPITCLRCDELPMDGSDECAAHTAESEALEAA